MEQPVSRIEFERLKARLERQMRQNTMLNNKLNDIIQQKKHYLRHRMEPSARKAWTKKLVEVWRLQQQIREKVGYFKHFPDRKTGEPRTLVWLTRAERLKLDRLLEKRP